MTISKFARISLATFLLATPAIVAIPTVADIVQNDDVIITFSLCVGNDCVNGESFGFDTIRLKENNVRIGFDDTSASASFPSNDWEIEINSSDNGGLSYFAIDDVTGAKTPFRIEAGAPTNALWVDDQGNIGIGEATPVVEVHIQDGDSPTVRLEQDGSSGFTSQTWDIAGNETNFFVRDVTNGSLLPFKIRPSARTNALYIDSDGQVALGNASPQAALHIEAAGNSAGVRLDNGSIGEWDVAVRNSDGELAINDQGTGGGDFIFKTADSATNAPWEFVHRADDGFGLNTGSSAGADFILSNTGNLSVLGTITSSGPTCASGCDAVFDADYDLPTIEDHAEAMFAKRHLPTVGPTSPDEPINLTEHMGNVLNELEKAHIYIAQLNEQNKALETRLAQIEKSLD
ncbi:MAG: hypothetical protein ABJO36_10410 [Litorimonas sp.]